MFQSLVITLREGVEAALIVGIVLGYLGKSGRQAWSRIVYWALAAAVAASLVAAILVHRLRVSEDTYEGWLMLLGAVFVASMAVWMWRTGSRFKQEIETKLSSISASPARFAAVAVFLFVFLMVLREGIETVLFLAAVSLRTTELLNFIGGAIGLALAVGLGVAFFKGSLKVNLRKFFSVTTLVLLVVALQLLVAGAHELSEARVLPSSPREMALIGPIVNNDTFLFLVVVALCVFLIVADRIRSSRPEKADLAQLSAPARRKARAEMQRDRFWKTATTLVGFVIMVLIGGKFIYSQVAQAVSPPRQAAIANGEVRVPVSELSDGKLHRYVVKVGSVDVRFLAILDSTNTVRAGLDACLICGTEGYYQEGANVICRHCAAAINIPTIGLPGGCNPIHIDYRVENGTMIIPEKGLAAAASVFR